MELNKIYNENCLATMSKMPDGFLDMTCTSPPYDNLRVYAGESQWTFELFQEIARELFRVTKQGGVVVWVVGDATVNGSETGTSFKQALYFKEIGFNLHDTMIYAKQNYTPLTHRRYEQCFEYQFILTKETLNIFNPLLKPNIHSSKVLSGTFRQEGAGSSSKHHIGPVADQSIKSNIWFYTVGTNSTTKDEIFHPAQFPEALAKDHILSWSNENDIVYDPFMGSGTTAKAAHQLKRQWIGSEISEEYVELANKRLEPYLMQETLF